MSHIHPKLIPNNALVKLRQKKLTPDYYVQHRHKLSEQLRRGFNWLKPEVQKQKDSRPGRSRQQLKRKGQDEFNSMRPSPRPLGERMPLTGGTGNCGRHGKRLTPPVPPLREVDRQVERRRMIRQKLHGESGREAALVLARRSHCRSGSGRAEQRRHGSRSSSGALSSCCPYSLSLFLSASARLRSRELAAQEKGTWTKREPTEPAKRPGGP